MTTEMRGSTLVSSTGALRRTTRYFFLFLLCAPAAKYDSQRCAEVSGFGNYRLGAQLYRVRILAPVRRLRVRSKSLTTQVE